MELAHYVGSVRLCRAGAYVEAFGDVGVGVSFRCELENFALTVAEAVEFISQYRFRS